MYTTIKSESKPSGKHWSIPTPTRTYIQRRFILLTSLIKRTGMYVTEEEKRRSTRDRTTNDSLSQGSVEVYPSIVSVSLIKSNLFYSSKVFTQRNKVNEQNSVCSLVRLLLDSLYSNYFSVCVWLWVKNVGRERKAPEFVYYVYTKRYQR